MFGRKLADQPAPIAQNALMAATYNAAQALPETSPAPHPARTHTSRAARSPHYNEAKTEVLKDVRERYTPTDQGPDANKRQLLDLLATIFETRKLSITEAEQHAIEKEVVDEVLGLGPLEILLAQDDISDIMINGHKRVFIEKNGIVRQADLHFDDDAQLTSIIQRIVNKVGRQIDSSRPVCDARLPDGSRVNAVLPPVSIDGPCLTIRKFKKEKLRLRDLVAYGSINETGMRLLEIIGRCRLNVLVSGGTGSGKTTLLNCLTAAINEHERIITCEDTAELQLQQPHVVRMETRPPNTENAGEITMRDLVKNCLRMRPERIIVGEVRGAEAFDLLQAMNTGHDGSMGTVHANSPRQAIERMVSLVLQANMGLPEPAIMKMVATSIDIIIQTERGIDGRRRVTHITELAGMEDNTPKTAELFVFEKTGIKNNKEQGKHRTTGLVKPLITEKVSRFGLADELFQILSQG